MLLSFLFLYNYITRYSSQGILKVINLISDVTFIYELLVCMCLYMCVCMHQYVCVLRCVCMSVCLDLSVYKFLSLSVCGVCVCGICVCLRGQVGGHTFRVLYLFNL